MWCPNGKFVFCVLLHHCFVNTALSDIVSPFKRPIDLTNSYHNVHKQQNIHAILNTIEERVHNLNVLYTTNFESQLNNYGAKLDAIDARIVRLEKLVMLSLDKISENISSKNFKDDMANTNMQRKVDSIYESFNHKLSYLERKIDHNIQKTQGKLDAALSRLEKMENLVTNKDSDMVSDISEALIAVDNLRSSQDLTDEVISEFKKISTGLNLEVKFSGLQNQIHILGSSILKTNKDLENQLNFTKDFFMTQKHNFVAMKKEIKNDLNNYAVKVSELGTFKGNLESGISKQLNAISKVLNGTQTNMQNGMRSLMVQIGRLGKVPSVNMSENVVAELEINLQKVLSNQEIFLEGCHRVQMDEAQIESEISTTLEKLIDMLSTKQDLELKEIKNIEKLTKNHDNKMYKALNIANKNILTLFDANEKQNEKVTNELRQVCHDIDALFTVIKDSVNSVSKRNETYINVLLSELGLIKTRLNYLRYESIPDLSPDLNDIKQMLNTMQNQTNYDDDMQKIIKTLNNIEQTVNNLIVNKTNVEKIRDKLQTILYMYAKKNQTEKLQVENVINTTTENVIKTTTENLFPETTTFTQNLTDEDIEKREKSILEIFGLSIKKDNQTSNVIWDNPEVAVVTEPSKKCRVNILGLIDVRNDSDCDEEIEEVMTTTYADLIDIRAKDE